MFSVSSCFDAIPSLIHSFVFSQRPFCLIFSASFWDLSLILLLQIPLIVIMTPIKKLTLIMTQTMTTTIFFAFSLSILDTFPLFFS